MKPQILKIAVIGTGLFLLAYSFGAYAAKKTLSTQGLFDTIHDKFQTAATGGQWQTVITGHATWLFWTLALISMVWTFGMMALRKADIAEFFSEFVKFTIFTGFYWWLLINGPTYAMSIVDSMRQMGGEATGTNGLQNLTPSSIVDVGFAICFAAFNNDLSMGPYIISCLIGLVCLIVITLIGVNMLLLMISAWFLAYGGIFFLGFGGSRWTSEMAIHYYKTVFGIGIQLLAMELIVGTGQQILTDQFDLNSTAGTVDNIEKLAVILVTCLILYVLTNKVPPLLSGIITGGGVGHMGGSGAMEVVAAGAAAGAAAMAGVTTAIAGAKEAAGGAQALHAAYQKAGSDLAKGTGGFEGITPGGFKGGGLAATLGNAAMIGTNMGANLVRGGASVACNNLQNSTTGGKIAAAIGPVKKDDAKKDASADKGQDKPSFGGNSIGGVASSAANHAAAASSGDETVDAFVNKDSSSAGEYYSSVESELDVEDKFQTYSTYSPEVGFQDGR